MRKFIFRITFLLFFIFCISYSSGSTLDDGKLKSIGVDKLKAYLIGSNLFAAEFLNSINSNFTSEACRTIWNNLEENAVYKFLDSSGKIGSSILRGNFIFLGDYDQCLDIHEELGPGIEVNSKYCTLRLDLEEYIGNIKGNFEVDFSLSSVNPTIGICLPSICSFNDVVRLSFNYYEKTKIKLIVENCEDKHNLYRFDGIHWVLMLFTLLLLMIIIYGTLVEHFSPNNRRFMQCFSIFQNTIEILKSSSNLDPNIEKLKCFHGFRVLRMIMIISIHAYTFELFTIDYKFGIYHDERRFLMQIVSNGSIWVDSFLLMSGFFIGFNVMKHKYIIPSKISSKNNESSKLKQFFKVIVHRYIRIVPSLMAVIAFSILIEPFGSGPVWHKYVAQSRSTCHNYWWLNLIGLNNLYKTKNMCITSSWYLSLDTQLFLVSTIFIAPLMSQNARWRKIGLILAMTTIIISCFIFCSRIYQHELTPTFLFGMRFVASVTSELDFFTKVYNDPVCRIGPYLIGILSAFLHLKINEKSRIDRTINKDYFHGSGILIAFSIIVLIIFMTWPYYNGSDYRNITAAIYGGTHRTIWSICWSYILLSCANEDVYGRVNRILSNESLLPLSKLSFQAYLLHCTIIEYFIYTPRWPIYASFFNQMIKFAQYSLLTFIVSFLFAISIEIPLKRLEQLEMKLRNKDWGITKSL